MNLMFSPILPLYMLTAFKIIIFIIIIKLVILIMRFLMMFSFVCSKSTLPMQLAVFTTQK